VISRLLEGFGNVRVGAVSREREVPSPLLGIGHDRSQMRVEVLAPLRTDPRDDRCCQERMREAEPGPVQLEDACGDCSVERVSRQLAIASLSEHSLRRLGD
jgi:hypothetical protein